MKQKEWNKVKETYEGGAGGPPEDLNDLSRGESGDLHREPRGQRGKSGSQVGTELQGLWGQ